MSGILEVPLKCPMKVEIWGMHGLNWLPICETYLDTYGKILKEGLNHRHLHYVCQKLTIHCVLPTHMVVWNCEWLNQSRRISPTNLILIERHASINVGHSDFVLYFIFFSPLRGEKKIRSIANKSVVVHRKIDSRIYYPMTMNLWDHHDLNFNLTN